MFGIRMFYDPLSMVASGAGVLTGAIQAISGGVNLRKDKAELSRLSQPFYKIQDEYLNNERSAAGLAGQGLTSAAKDLYTDTAGRGLGAAVGGVTATGGSPNDIGAIFDKYLQSTRAVGAEDSQRQIENIKYYHQVGKELAGQKTMKWTLDQYKPYQNKLKELTQRIGADKQNIWGGINAVVGATQAGITASQNQDLLKGLYKSSSSPGQSGMPSLGAIQSAISGASAVRSATQGSRVLNLQDPYPVDNGYEMLDETNFKQ